MAKPKRTITYKNKPIGDAVRKMEGISREFTAASRRGALDSDDLLRRSMKHMELLDSINPDSVDSRELTRARNRASEIYENLQGRSGSTQAGQKNLPKADVSKMRGGDSAWRVPKPQASGPVKSIPTNGQTRPVTRGPRVPYNASGRGLLGSVPEEALVGGHSGSPTKHAILRDWDKVRDYVNDNASGRRPGAVRRPPQNTYPELTNRFPRGADVGPRAPGGRPLLDAQVNPKPGTPSQLRVSSDTRPRLAQGYEPELPEQGIRRRNRGRWKPTKGSRIPTRRPYPPNTGQRGSLSLRQVRAPNARALGLLKNVGKIGLLGAAQMGLNYLAPDNPMNQARDYGYGSLKNMGLDIEGGIRNIENPLLRGSAHLANGLLADPLVTAFGAGNWVGDRIQQELRGEHSTNQLSRGDYGMMGRFNNG